jgi:chromosome partitioning protein
MLAVRQFTDAPVRRRVEARTTRHLLGGGGMVTMSRRRAVARVISAAMQKGGVGKTTTIINLARAAAVRGLRVLVVDLDPQGNTTTALAKAHVARDQLTIADAIVPEDAVPLHEVIVESIWPGVDLAPAVTHTLSKAEKLIAVAEHGREQRLTETLEPVLVNYDLVLIDNAPALGQLLLNALVASDEVFVVAEADQWSCDGLAELRVTVNMAKKYYNHDLHWSGVLISKWRDTADERYWLNEITTNFAEAPVWTHDKIPLWSSIKTTLGAGKGLDEAKEARLRVLAHSYRRILARWVLDDEVTI